MESLRSEGNINKPSVRDTHRNESGVFRSKRNHLWKFSETAGAHRVSLLNTWPEVNIPTKMCNRSNPACLPALDFDSKEAVMNKTSMWCLVGLLSIGSAGLSLAQGTAQLKELLSGWNSNGLRRNTVAILTCLVP
jgi:hypothetical protein